MSSAPDDAALLAAWSGGDRAAGEALFARYFDAIYRFFDRKGVPDVSDLVQRTFLGCVEARARFRGASSFRTFLFAIARHELYGSFRARHARGNVDFGVSSVADLAPGPSTQARGRGDREALLAALVQLPVDLQLTLELRFWEGLSGPELAEVLEVPEGTARSRLRRGLEALREVLERGGDAPGLLARLPTDPEAALDAWAASLRDEPPA